MTHRKESMMRYAALALSLVLLPGLALAQAADPAATADPTPTTGAPTPSPTVAPAVPSVPVARSVIVKKDPEVGKLKAKIRTMELELKDLKREMHKDDDLPFGTYRLVKDLHLDFHGYYRARAVRATNIPLRDTNSDPTFTFQPGEGLVPDQFGGRDDASDAHYVTSRLRFNPTLRWGGDPTRGKTPKVALHAQIDVLDNVVWGDNARSGSVPLFAENPTNTDVWGQDRESFFLRRLWVDVLTPLGLIKAGRQASQGGLGLLFNDGNGFRNDFGDAEGGSTFDRVVFATRPLTIVNALAKGDKRPTPLILVIGHDWLVEDPLGFANDPAAPSSRLSRGPFGWLTNPTCGGDKGERPADGSPTEKCDNDVRQWIYGLIWKDPDLNVNQKTDELLAGLIYINRVQDFNGSSMHILDGFWRLNLGLSKTGPSLYTEGEFSMIKGETDGIPLLNGGYNDETGLAQNTLTGGVLNMVGRLGLKSPKTDGWLEVGHSRGDEQLIGGDGVFKMFPVHADYRVGLLMYPMVLYARSANTFGGSASGALNSGGGIFNSTYFMPKLRYRIKGQTNEIELIGQGIFAWADTLNGGYTPGFATDYFSPRDDYKDNECKLFDSDCNIGWEADIAVKIKWLRRDLGNDARDNYLVRWSNEFGIMGAGDALKDRLAKGADILWSYQTRIAFVW
jgi:hypothetical protein